MSFLLWPFQFLLSLPILAACALTLAAWFKADQGWLWSLTTHFRVQYLGIQLLALILAGISYALARQNNSPQPGKWLSMVLLAFFAGLNLVVIAPYYLPTHRPDRVDVANRQAVSLMHINLFGNRNVHTDKVVQAIQDGDPDVLVLVEYTPRWQERLGASQALRRYPHRITTNHLGMYSKRPLQEKQVFYTNPTFPEAGNHTTLMGRIQVNGEPVTILAAHAASPDQPEHWQWQRQSFDYWSKHRQRFGENLILVGDLNTAPWSHEFTQLTQAMGLRDSQLGYGLQPSWPVFIPNKRFGYTPSPWATLLRIPIDHVLVSERVMVLSRRLGDYTGSDHLPVHLTFALRASGQ